jgi:hypothetical protein
MLLPRITHVEHIQDYVLALTFSNGVQAELDLRDRVIDRSGMLAPLSEVDFFRRVEVDPEAGTLVWPNGVDFCPDVLYSLATGEPLPTLEPA